MSKDFYRVFNFGIAKNKIFENLQFYIQKVVEILVDWVYKEKSL